MKSRIVITGLGIISSLGIGKKDVWQNMLSGKNAVFPIQSFDTTKFRVKVASEILDFTGKDFFKEQKLQNIDRTAQYAYSTTQMALKDSGLEPAEYQSIPVGVSIGSTMGSVQTSEYITRKMKQSGLSEIPVEKFHQYPANSINKMIFKKFGLQGPSTFFFNACASGNYAIGHACNMIRRQECDIVIAGGVDAFSWVAFTGFNRLLSLTPDICRPFDKKRKGLAVGEGAGIILLESLEHARKRNAKIYAELKGFGLGMDAYHMTSPHPEGKGAIQAMSQALKNAQLNPSQIDYISAHGTGTPANDKTESIAIQQVFASAESIPPASSIKSMIGHAMGAASGIEAVMSCLMLENNIMLPTIHYETPDEKCIQDCVANVPREKKLTHILSNSFAFGGNASCIVISKLKDE